MQELAKALIILAVALGLVGLLLWTGFFPRWFGRLPGDIRIERTRSVFLFPVVTCILISLLVSLFFSFFRR